jgi:hypothetical protein
VRLLEDYLIVPRVLGDAVGMSPLLVLSPSPRSGSSSAASRSILRCRSSPCSSPSIDVVVRDKDPAEETSPTVLFPAKERRRD